MPTYGLHGMADLSDILDTEGKAIVGDIIRQDDEWQKQFRIWNDPKSLPENVLKASKIMFRISQEVIANYAASKL